MKTPVVLDLGFSTGGMTSLSPDEFKNYRPVSDLGFFSKLGEHVVAFQLNDHVIGLDNVNKSAYKHGHLTENALLLIKNDVHLALARGEATDVVL